MNYFLTLLVLSIGSGTVTFIGAYIIFWIVDFSMSEKERKKREAANRFGALILAIFVMGASVVNFVSRDKKPLHFITTKEEQDYQDSILLHSSIQEEHFWRDSFERMQGRTIKKDSL